MTYRTLIFVGLTAGMLLTPLVAASGQSKIYPPGTNCANLPTIAERLLCGRQEFRRQSDSSTQVPAPGSTGESRGLEGQAPLPSQNEMEPALLPMPRIIPSQERTSSPTH